MEVQIQLIRIGKLFKRIGLAFFGLIWIELLVMIIPKYKSLGETIYENYGVNGLAIYLSLFITVALFFLWSNTRIGLIEKEYLKEKANISNTKVNR